MGAIADELGENISSALQNKSEYIRLVRAGLSGSVVRLMVEMLGRDIVVRALHTNKTNLPRCYQRAALNSNDTESILDSLRTFCLTEKVWCNKVNALEWLNTPVPALDRQAPVDLFDTFAGREWVRQTLKKIETGDFS